MDFLQGNNLFVKVIKTKHLTHKKIAEKYSVTINIVADINRGKTWKQI